MTSTAIGTRTAQRAPRIVLRYQREADAALGAARCEDLHDGERGLDVDPFPERAGFSERRLRGRCRRCRARQSGLRNAVGEGPPARRARERLDETRGHEGREVIAQVGLGRRRYLGDEPAAAIDAQPAAAACDGADREPEGADARLRVPRRRRVGDHHEARARQRDLDGLAELGAQPGRAAVPSLGHAETKRLRGLGERAAGQQRGHDHDDRRQPRSRRGSPRRRHVARLYPCPTHPRT